MRDRLKTRLVRGYVRVQTAAATLHHDEQGSMTEWIIVIVLVLAVLGVAALLIANATSGQASNVEAGINAIPVTNFSP